MVQFALFKKLWIKGEARQFECDEFTQLNEKQILSSHIKSLVHCFGCVFEAVIFCFGSGFDWITSDTVFFLLLFVYLFVLNTRLWYFLWILIIINYNWNRFVCVFIMQILLFFGFFLPLFVKSIRFTWVWISFYLISDLPCVISLQLFVFFFVLFLRLISCSFAYLFVCFWSI